ncbi:hypothetical protein JG687_00016870, partial [Phytophthora cactorum]
LAYGLSVRRSLLSTMITEPATRKLEALGAVGDGSEAWGDVGAGEIVVAGTRGRGTRRGRGESKLCEELQVASVRWETTVLVAVVFSTKKLLWSAVHEDEVVVLVLAEWTLVVTSLQVTVPLSPR